jgi:hypothetical protein
VLAAQVTLIPSSQMAYTYPYARGHLLYRRSRVELLKPDYQVRWSVLCQSCGHTPVGTEAVSRCAACALIARTCTHIGIGASSCHPSCGHAACGPPFVLHGCSRVRLDTAKSNTHMTIAEVCCNGPPAEVLFKL